MADDLKDPADRSKWTEALEVTHAFDIEERRLEVQRLKFKGGTVRGIAAQLGVSPSTIQLDIKAIKAANAAAEGEITSEDRLAEAMVHYRELEAQAWRSYHAAQEGSMQALKALDLLRVIQSDKIKALRDTGFIRDAPAQVEVQVSHRLEQIATPELMAELSIALIEKGLTPQLAEPVPENEILDAEVVEYDEENDTGQD